MSAADLVDILSKGSDPTAVLVHIGKIVDSLDTFQMIGDSKVPVCTPPPCMLNSWALLLHLFGLVFSEGQ